MYRYYRFTTFTNFSSNTTIRYFTVKIDNKNYLLVKKNLKYNHSYARHILNYNNEYSLSNSNYTFTYDFENEVNLTDVLFIGDFLYCELYGSNDNENWEFVSYVSNHITNIKNSDNDSIKKYYIKNIRSRDRYITIKDIGIYNNHHKADIITDINNDESTTIDDDYIIEFDIIGDIPTIIYFNTDKDIISFDLYDENSNFLSSYNLNKNTFIETDYNAVSSKKVKNFKNDGGYINLTANELPLKMSYIKHDKSFASSEPVHNTIHIKPFNEKVKFKFKNNHIECDSKGYVNIPLFKNKISYLHDYENKIVYSSEVYGKDTLTFFIEGKTKPVPYTVIHNNNQIHAATSTDVQLYNVNKNLDYYIQYDNRLSKLYTNMQRGFIDGKVNTDCKNTNYVIKCFRSIDNFYIGDYEIVDNKYIIDSLDVNKDYDIVLYDLNLSTEPIAKSKRTPKKY